MMRAMLSAMLAMLAGCATQTPRIVTTPAVCPAPRTVPVQTLAAIAALPDHLPPLVIQGDAAAALYETGIRSAGLYRQCVEAARGAAGWIDGSD